MSSDVPREVPFGEVHKGLVVIFAHLTLMDLQCFLVHPLGLGGAHCHLSLQKFVRLKSQNPLDDNHSPYQNYLKLPFLEVHRKIVRTAP